VAAGQGSFLQNVTPPRDGTELFSYRQRRLPAGQGTTASGEAMRLYRALQSGRTEGRLETTWALGATFRADRWVLRNPIADLVVGAGYVWRSVKPQPI